MSKFRNKHIAEQFTMLPCDVCGSSYKTVGHHILTVGSHPQYAEEYWNLIPLCWDHHREIHDKGTRSFVEKYKLQDEFILRGFIYCDFRQKWIKES